jgi:hypothetical protein
VGSNSIQEGLKERLPAFKRSKESHGYTKPREDENYRSNLAKALN